MKPWGEQTRLALTGMAWILAACGFLYADDPSGADSDRPPEEAEAGALRRETLAVIRKLIEDYPARPDANRLMGMYHLKYGDPDKAYESLRRALDRDPSYAEAYYNMAEIAIKQGDYEKVLECCRKAVELDPKHTRAVVWIGRSLLELGRPEEAIASLRAALEQDPTLINMDYFLGKAYLQLKKYDKVVRHLERTIHHLPESEAEPYYLLGKAYARLGQPDRARAHNETFRRLQAAATSKVQASRKERDRDFYDQHFGAKALTEAGKVYYLDGQVKIAETCWRRAASLDEKNDMCRYFLADVHVGRREWTEALALYDQILGIDPDKAVYHLNRGAALGQLRRLEESEKAFRAAIRLVPGNSQGYRSLLQVLTQAGRPLPEVKTVLEKLVALEPTAKNFVLLSDLCRRTGDPGGALSALGRAHELAPENPKISQAYHALKEGR